MQKYNDRPVEVIDKNKPLTPGDLILIRFEWLTNNKTVRAAQYAAIEKHLSQRRDFEVITIYSVNDLFLDFEILIKSKYLGGDPSPTDEEPWHWPEPSDPDEPIFQTHTLMTAIAITAASIAAIVWGITSYLKPRSYYAFVDRNIDELNELAKTDTAKSLSQAVEIGAYTLLAGVVYFILRGFKFFRRT